MGGGGGGGGGGGCTGCGLDLRNRDFLKAY